MVVRSRDEGGIFFFRRRRWLGWERGRKKESQKEDWSLAAEMCSLLKCGMWVEEGGEGELQEGKKMSAGSKQG